MSKLKAYCFSANRLCHHDDYFLLLRKYREIENVKNLRKKIRILFSKTTIIYLDIDSMDLLFLPIILLRSIWGGNGIGLSVRTEYLLESRTLKHFLFKRRRLIYIKSLVKRTFFFLIKDFSSTKIISIHKGHKSIKSLEPYVNYFIYDPQLWDLKILNIVDVKPIELNDDYFRREDNTILVAGRFDGQRSKLELISYLKSQPKIKFLIAGKMEDKDYLFLTNQVNCTVINRYLSNEELIYLYKKCQIVYCFYTNDRPSGFFGRALQLNKLIIVRKNRFLDNMFKNYKNIIAVDHLSELNSIDFSIKTNDSGNSHYDDSLMFKELLYEV